MLTEQEAIAQLNERIKENKVKPATSKYLIKMRILESNLSTKQTEIKELLEKIKQLKAETVRIKGAISMLIELAAEEEGILPELSESSDKINNSNK
jgi:hypothetical protein